MKTITIIAIMLILSGCATIEPVKSHYILKVCDPSYGCKILDVIDSLSNCIDLKLQIIESDMVREAVICQGFREP